jgi:formylglycine-generating enzyme required for sulfatase activity
MKTERFSLRFLPWVLLAGFVLSASACQAPFFQTGAAGALRFELYSPVPGLLANLDRHYAMPGSRMLTADASTVNVTISTSTATIFDQDAPVTNDSGKPTVTITVTNVPLGKALDIAVKVKNANGAIILTAAQTMTFTANSSTTPEKLVLVPTADCPGVLTLAAGADSLTVPAGTSRIIALSVEDSLLNTISRLSWAKLTDPVDIKLYDSTGASIEGAPVLQGRAGTVFTPQAAGKVYATVYNAGAANLTLSSIALAGNTGTVTISLGDPASRKVVFSQTTFSVPLGGSKSIVLASSGATGLTGWQWTIDGAVDTTQTSASYEFDATIHGLGSYVLGVSVTSGGVLYSGSATVTVVSAAAAQYTVTYSNQYADSGTAPVDAGAYASGNPATVASNTGNLARSDCAFLGWTKDPAGYGTLLPAGTQINVTADTILYPFWGMRMAPVPGGTFSRDGGTVNVSTVSSFFMGKYPVTRQQYLATTGTDPSTAGYSTGMADPVQQVTWFDAVEFCNKLSLAEGLDPVYGISGRTPVAGYPITAATVTLSMDSNGYRLPTDAEWQWAAMGGLSDAKASDWSGALNLYGYNKDFAGSDGVNALLNYACLAANSGGKTKPVGSFLPNELGLYDMAGNVYNWTWDWVAAYPSGQLTDYTGAVSAAKRAIHNGAFNLPVPNYSPLKPGSTLQSCPPVWQYFDVGFRVARKAAATSYVPRSGLVAEYLFNNQTLGDTSGSGRTGSAGHGSYTTNTHTGSGYGYTADYSVTTNPPTFGNTNSFSISIWFNPSAALSTRSLTYGSGPSCNYGILGSSNASSFSFGAQIGQNGGNYYTNTGTAGSVPVLSWHHTVMVFDTVTKKLEMYIDGALACSVDSTTTVNAPLTLSAPTSASFGTSNCMVDNIRIYNRALSAAEVTALYQE